MNIFTCKCLVIDLRQLCVSSAKHFSLSTENLLISLGKVLFLILKTVLLDLSLLTLNSKRLTVAVVAW